MQPLDEEEGEIKPAHMTIFSSEIIKDCFKSNGHGFNPDCRQIQILNGNDDECMVLSHFHDGLKTLKLRRQKDYKLNTTTSASMFILQDLVKLPIMLQMLYNSSKTYSFYEIKTGSIIMIFKSEATHMVHTNIVVCKYSIGHENANIISYSSKGMEEDSDSAFYVLLGSDQSIYGITIQQEKEYTTIINDNQTQIMIIKMYKLQSSGWSQLGFAIKIPNCLYRYDERNIVIIGTKVYLFGISMFSFTDLCCTYYDPAYTTNIGILDFENKQYEIKHNLMHGEILYSAIPFGLGYRYVALFPERYHYIDKFKCDTFKNHPSMLLFDLKTNKIIKLRQKIPRPFYYFIASYAEDCETFLAKDIAELLIFGWIRSFDLLIWPCYMNRIVLKYYYLEPKIGICGLYECNDNSLTNTVYVSISFDMTQLN